jgi:phenylalanyl-tRNA synthetase beta chain
MGDISFPVRYSVVEPGSTRFRPLGEAGEMTLAEVLTGTETGLRYAPLLQAFDRYPLLSDSSGGVLSFPPVINSDDTGRVRVGDDHLFCEVTGTDWSTVQLSATILACNLEDRGFRIAPIEIVHQGRLPTGGSRVLTPMRFMDALSAARSRIDQVLGVHLDDSEIVRALGRMGWDSWRISPDSVEAVMPPYRHDGIHEVDLIEDLSIGYGMDRFEPLMPEGYTIGTSAPLEDLADALRQTLAGAGCEEVLLPILTSESRPGTPPGIVTIRNPMTQEYGSVRNSLLPGLLACEAASAHAPYPHRVFEVGEVLESGPGGIETVVMAAVLVSGNEASFGDTHSIIGLVCHSRGHELKLEPVDDPRFIPGRCCLLHIDGREAGRMGEIHPALLMESGITRPASALEIRLEALDGNIQG